MPRGRRSVGITFAILAFAVPLHAEPIQITSGALVFLSREVTLVGSGFTFAGHAGFGQDPIDLCRVPVCQAGSSVDLLAHFVGLDLSGTATLNGQTFTNVGSSISDTSLSATWAGTLAIPTEFNGGVLTAPFTFSGVFFIFQLGAVTQQELFGQGTASFTFARQGSDPSAFHVTAATYEFESGATPAPVPEPMSITLVGAGLAGLAALRRLQPRRSRRHLRPMR
jgi:hypothetical protein